MTVQPFPWAALPRVDRRGARAVGAVAAWLPGPVAEVATGTGAIAIRTTDAIALDGAGIAAALADPTAVVIALRGIGAQRVFAVASAAIARAVTQAILGGPPELAAPRAPTLAERAVLAYAVAAALTAVGSTATAELLAIDGPALAAQVGAATLVELALGGAVTGRAALLIPRGAELAPPRRPLAVLARPVWLDEPRPHPVAIGWLATTPAALRTLAARDVAVVDGGGAILIGRGAVPVALAIGAAQVTVRASYARGSSGRGSMDETLGDDMTVEVAAVAGAVELSVRRALELAPGEVLALGRPLGGPIELRIGRRVIARGELVDVDGELGVRIVEVTPAPSTR